MNIHSSPDCTYFFLLRFGMTADCRTCKIQSTLLKNGGDHPLARALFTLKSFGNSTAHVEPGHVPISDAAIHVIAAGFTDASVLIKHELAYVLGQMANPHAVPVLEQVLGDVHQDAMVRHEVRPRFRPAIVCMCTSAPRAGCGGPRRARVHGVGAHPQAVLGG